VEFPTGGIARDSFKKEGLTQWNSGADS